jgi:hypothetical protein
MGRVLTLKDTRILNRNSDHNSDTNSDSKCLMEEFIRHWLLQMSVRSWLIAQANPPIMEPKASPIEKEPL